MSAWVRVAKIAKTRNLEGSVVARCADELPFLLFEGLQVRFVPPSLTGPRGARVGSVSELKEGSYEVAFEGIDTIEDAESITGCYCLAARSDLPEQMAEMPIGWMHFAVCDEDLGDLGTVEEVQASAAQSLLVVNGPRGSFMIPVVDEFIADVDTAARTIGVHIPESLIDLADSVNDGEGGDA